MASAAEPVVAGPSQTETDVIDLTTCDSDTDAGDIFADLRRQGPPYRTDTMEDTMYRQHGFIVQYFDWRSGQYLLICDIDDCVSEQICVNHEIEADDFDVSLLMSLLTIDDCIFEEICVNNEIDADDFDVSLLTIDDDIFEYHERNVQLKKCARKSESRRSRPKLRERMALWGCRGRQVRPGTCHRTRW